MRPVRKRKAFLIGQDKYLEEDEGGFGKLKCCVKDVEALEKVLGEKCDFEVTRMKDYENEHFKTLRERILPQNVEGGPDGPEDLEEGRDGAIILVYYSGHGVEINRQMFLVPTDARRDDPETWASLDKLLRNVHDLCGRVPTSVQADTAEACSARPAPGTLVIVILDCCREVPDLGTAVHPESMTRAESWNDVDTEICYIYACDPRRKAKESADLGHGILTHCLLEAIDTCQGQNFCKLWSELHSTCLKASESPHQRPWLVCTSSMLPELVLYPSSESLHLGSGCFGGSPKAPHGVSSVQAPSGLSSLPGDGAGQSHAHEEEDLGAVTGPPAAQSVVGLTPAPGPLLALRNSFARVGAFSRETACQALVDWIVTRRRMVVFLTVLAAIDVANVCWGTWLFYNHVRKVIKPSSWVLRELFVCFGLRILNGVLFVEKRYYAYFGEGRFTLLRRTLKPILLSQLSIVPFWFIVYFVPPLGVTVYLLYLLSSGLAFLRHLILFTYMFFNHIERNRT